MELWIRSQDRESLVKVDNLYISVGNYICYYVEKGKEVPNTYYRPSGELGRYATKERALEVLDEIQNIFSLKIENKSYDEADLVLKAKMLNSVYEMPKE